MPTPSTDSLLDAARQGDRAALARILSLVERGGSEARDLGRAVTGAASAYTVGITGSPGAGKSTLTSALLRTIRRSGDTVAVLAIDPTSPFSGGAILGDRVRMGDHALDDGVFVRSMATRGHLGGLAVAAPEAVRVLSSVGFDWVLVETVGVGQIEVEIAGQADTTVVVVNPGWGDAVQAAKAGLTEIADIFVVNKADRPGAAEAKRDLERALAMSAGSASGWTPPVLTATSTSGEGVDELWDAVARHHAHLDQSGELIERRRRRASDEVTRLVAVELLRRARVVADSEEAIRLAEQVVAGTLDPWTAAESLLSDSTD